MKYRAGVRLGVTRAVILGLALCLAACGGGGNGNSPPVADAGADQRSGVLVGDAVVLDGSASSDANNDSLGYAWSLTTLPTGSSASLTDPSSDKPAFIADKAGGYVARLVVNDGRADSAPDEVSVTVVIPAPAVIIATPVPGSTATASPVAVSGTVDDPQAAITINGTATPNNNGSYGADLALVEGRNTVTVVATNSTGAGSDSVEVDLKTAPAPVISISSPGDQFTTNSVDSADITVQVTGTIKTAQNSGTPTVTVNGVAATVTTTPIVCPSGDFCIQVVASGYNFAATIPLNNGPQTIIAIGSDTLGGSAQAQVSGVADYCKKGSADAAAQRGNGQNNRCHEIDGCNRNKFGLQGDTDTVSLRNQPMPNAIHNLVTVEFGAGYIPPEDPRNDFFVHGQSPARALGCNLHDTCYQTCVPPGDRDAAFSACNEAQRENHRDMCRKAYPGAECPFTITGPFGNTFKDPVKCPVWVFEKNECFSIAGTYFTGVSTRFGRDRYDERQSHFCLR